MRPWAMALGMAAALVVTVAIGFTLARLPLERREAFPWVGVAAPMETQTVSLHFASSPSGAQVMDNNGTILGNTPVSFHAPKSTKVLTFVVRSLAMKTAITASSRPRPLPRKLRYR